MAFKQERFSLLHTNYDKTQLAMYSDTVGTGTGKDGNTLAQITTAGFFNELAKSSNVVTGTILIITAVDGFAVGKLNVSTIDGTVTITTSGT